MELEEETSQSDPIDKKILREVRRYLEENEIKISNTGVTVSEKFLEVLSAEDDFIQFEIKKFL